MALTARVEEWRRSGEERTLRGRRIFVRERLGEGTPLLFLHGFPSSSYDWHRLLPLLGDRPTTCFDFLGFGLSEKPRDLDYTLAAQADIAEELAGGRRMYVVAHDMGTSVATELFARDLAGELSFEIAGALLFNGSILIERAKPTLGQKLLRSPLGGAFARLSSARFFRAQLGQVFSSGHPLSADEAADQWSLWSHLGGNRIGHRLMSYMDERVRHAERWNGAFRDWPGDLRLAWGLEDPVARVAVLEGLRELRPGVPVTELPELGHYPQIESPERMAEVVQAACAEACD